MRAGYTSTTVIFCLIPALAFLFETASAAEESQIRSSPQVTASNVLVVANSAYAGSQDLAKLYATRRGIPADNILALELPATEDIDRECFNTKILEPIQRKIRASQAEILCIVTVYGVPLNIWDPQPIQAEISKLKQELKGIKEGMFQGDAVVLEKKVAGLEIQVKETAKRAASVDSELTLAGRDHPLEGFVESPFLTESGWPQGCYWAARLDASTPEDVRRMIEGALEAESKGLRGTAYFDARGLTGDGAYARADKGILAAAALAREAGLPAVLDNREELFGVGKCPEAALYWGWYSLAKYVDSFRFVPGAVAVHIASGECNSLREGEYWCRNLIRNGACVTMGPTNEPYLEAFPAADEFLRKLFAGESIGGAYYATEKWLSWRMVLLGDPLYRPFGAQADENNKHQEKRE